MMYIVGDAIEELSKLTGIYDGVLTSPPYNFGENPRHRKLGKKDKDFYDKYKDNMSLQSFIDYIVSLFKTLEAIIKPDGVICWNQGSSSKTPSLPFEMIGNIIQHTDWTVVDVIYWQKATCMPFQTSPNKTSPLVEPVYIFARKDYIKTHTANKPLGKKNEKTGQQFYGKVCNLFQAKNGKSTTDNFATYSVDFAEEMLNRYFKKNDTVIDPFVGSGTTLIAANKLDMNGIGIDISDIQRDSYISRERYIKNPE